MLHFAVLFHAVLLCSISLQVFCSKIGLAPYIEVAMYHKKAKALMVTDAVVYIPEDPPEASSHSLLPCMSMSDHVSEHEQNITLFCMYTETTKLQYLVTSKPPYLVWRCSISVYCMHV